MFQGSRRGSIQGGVSIEWQSKYQVESFSRRERVVLFFGSESSALLLPTPPDVVPSPKHSSSAVSHVIMFDDAAKIGSVEGRRRLENRTTQSELE